MATREPSGRNSATDHPGLVAVARQVIDANRYLVLGTASPSIGTHVIGDADRRCRGQRAAGRCRERARVLPDPTQGRTSA
jgi:hypothetical protein